MDFIIAFLTQYGYWGMLLAAFLAGSFFPFSSEAVMVGLMATGLDPWLLMVYGTIGNVLGSIVNYGVGRMGKMEWIEKYLHVKKEDLDRAHRFIAGHGSWIGFFAFLPILGSAITIALGLMRANIVIRDYISAKYGYNLNRTCDEIRPVYDWDSSCQGTVPEAMVAFFDSTDFESAIRLAVSLGGDSDTLACITGGIAEAFYKDIPDDIALKIWSLLPDDFKDIIKEMEQHSTYRLPSILK